MTQYADHVGYQLTNELTRVNLLPDATKFKDTILNAGISMVKGDKGPTWKMNKFEDAAAYLTPWDPVAKKSNNNRKRGAAEISNTFDGGALLSATRAKQVRVSTEDDSQYHKYGEFKTMPKEQRDEILEWGKSYKNGGTDRKHDQGNSNNNSKRDNKPTKKVISASVSSNISQLYGSDNKSDVEEKNNPT